MIVGKVWKFGDNIDTDLMVPGPVLYASEEEQARAVFSANRPGWVDLVKKGDIIVGGRNFGIGSSRPAARSLRNVGVACLLAESVNGLFFRNAVNLGFPAFECPGLHAGVEENQLVELSIENWTVRNKETDQEFEIRAVPPLLFQLMMNGGVFPVLERDGLVSSTRPNLSARSQPEHVVVHFAGAGPQSVKEARPQNAIGEPREPNR